MTPIWQSIADAYYDSLPNKSVVQPKRIVLFSGVPGSGKTTIAQALELELRGVRLSNDEIRERITAAEPHIEPKTREHAKFLIVTHLLERIARETQGLIIIDASCDRGYGYYRDWAEKYGYQIVLLRLDIPRQMIEQRIHTRNSGGYRTASEALAKLDTWWRQWQAFGREYVPALTITAATDLSEILAVVRDTR